MTTRLAIDVGGTFTDVLLYDDVSGSMSLSKVRSTPASPDDAAIAGVAQVADERALASLGLFFHGTTVGLNALLQRRGAVVGLLTTRGFRDVLEIRRGERGPAYDPLWKAPAPLVPRGLRLPVTERILADGTVLTDLVEEDVVEALRVFGKAGVNSIAVVFLNTYANPMHELAAARIVREQGFDGDISMSHEVSGEFREYERTSTTVIDAFIRPKTVHYFRRLQKNLRAKGFAGSCLVTRSGGGSMLFEDAERRCCEIIMSGPVAGAVGAAKICRQLGISRAISADVGGTSFDCCMVIDGRPPVKYQGAIDGMPIQTPWVDIRSIGAGGGSIAYVDQGGLLRVGPRSASSVPGPACYELGGQEPAVTDAAAWLGMLAEGELGGGVRLNFGLARAALDKVGGQLSMSTDEVAQGVLRIAAADMAQAIRSVTVERGEDPRQAALVAFGGAGPLFATLLASDLEVTQVLVPRFAGNFSAWGLLHQDITHSAARTCVCRVDESGLARVSGILQGLFERLEADMAASCPGETMVYEAAVDLRYEGQEHTLTIPMPWQGSHVAANLASLCLTFADEYQRTFSHCLEAEVEFVTARATLRVPLPEVSRDYTALDDRLSLEARASVEAFSFVLGRRIPFEVVRRSSLHPGAALSKPVILIEETCTTYVDAGFDLRVDPSGVLVLTKTEVV